MTTATAVLDIGKTNIKLAVVARDGRVLESRATANVWRAGPPYPHADTDAIWDWVIAGLTDLGRNVAIGSIVTATHGATAALIDGQKLALPVLDYEFQDVTEFDEAYEPLARDFPTTLSPRLPAGLNLARQIYWQSRRFSEPFRRATAILTYPQYWSWRLGGVLTCEVTSLGCHTDLWRPMAADFSSLVDIMNWRALFPPLRPGWEAVGRLRPDLAAATGLSADCRVVNGIHDSNASFLRHLSRRPKEPFCVVSTGTWVVVMAANASVDRLDPAADMLANVGVNGAPIACARFMGGREYAVVAGDIKVTADLADVQAVISSGTMAIPAFTDQGGPYRAKAGRITGPSPKNPIQRAALASLYCALVTDDCLARLGGSGDIVVEGPFAGNSAYCGILAALRPKQIVFRAEDTTGTMTGAALLAHWPATDQSTLQTVIPWRSDNLESYRRSWERLLANGQ